MCTDTTVIQSHFLYLVLTHENLLKTDDRCITQLAKMSIDPEFVELTAGVVRILV